MRPIITIEPLNRRGIRWVRVRTARRSVSLGGYEAGRAESLRFALTLAQSYKREKSKRAAIVLESGGKA